MNATTRTALVSGGAGGIGQAICAGLVAAGHRVAMADLETSSHEATAAELGCLPVTLDVTSPSSIKASVSSVEKELGAIDIVVSCAGWDELRPFIDTDEELQHRVLDINLGGPMRLARAVLPGMIERHWGRLVFIASDAGRVGSSLEAIYSGAKGGLIAFAKTIAREVARHGITANSVCPGPTDTPLLSGLFSQSESGGRVLEAMKKSVPMRRLGLPSDIAPAVVFLASEGAGFITGQPFL